MSTKIWLSISFGTEPAVEAAEIPSGIHSSMTSGLPCWPQAIQIAPSHRSPSLLEAVEFMLHLKFHLIR